MSFRVMLAGGGSGGHVYPLVAVAEELKRQAPQSGKSLEVRFIGDGELIHNAADELGIRFHHVMAPKWRRYFSMLNFLDLLKLPVGFFQACLYVWLFMPDAMLIKGGYASFLPALAAKLMAVPLIVHESDSVPGKVNLWWGKLSRRVFVAYEYTRKYFNPKKTEMVGSPIRPKVVTPIDRESALASFTFKGDKPVVLVLGGSQGAQKINEVVLTSLIELVKTYAIILQCGDANFGLLDSQLRTIIKEEATSYAAVIQEDFRMFGNLSELQMAQAYSVADVIVSRAGSAIFEIAAVGKPVILIPLKDAAQNHQLFNAKEFEASGAFLLEQDNVTPHLLQQAIAQVYTEREERSQKIRQFAKPNAAVTIAQELLAA